MTIQLTSTDRGLEAVVTGPWTTSDEHDFVSSRATGLTLNYALGYQERSLEFIRGLRIERLTVLSRTTKDLTPIYSLAENLVELQITSDPRAALDLTRLEKLTQLSADWSQVSATAFAGAKVETAYFGSYSEESLVPLQGMTSLVSLMMKDRPQLRSLEGLTGLPLLRALTVAGALALTDISDLMLSGAPKLQLLSLGGCKKIGTLNDIVRQSRLTRLDFGDCGPLPTLAPLRALTMLRELFLDESTLVIDGDLQPLLDLPDLRILGMRNRKHYAPSLKVVESRLEDRAASS